MIDAEWMATIDEGVAGKRLNRNELVFQSVGLITIPLAAAFQ